MKLYVIAHAYIDADSPTLDCHTGRPIVFKTKEAAQDYLKQLYKDLSYDNEIADEYIDENCIELYYDFGGMDKYYIHETEIIC